MTPLCTSATFKLSLTSSPDSALYRGSSTSNSSNAARGSSGAPVVKQPSCSPWQQSPPCDSTNWNLTSNSSLALLLAWSTSDASWLKKKQHRLSPVPVRTSTAWMPGEVNRSLCKQGPGPHSNKQGNKRHIILPSHPTPHCCGRYKMGEASKRCKSGQQTWRQCDMQLIATSGRSQSSRKRWTNQPGDKDSRHHAHRTSHQMTCQRWDSSSSVPKSTSLSQSGIGSAQAAHLRCVMIVDFDEFPWRVVVVVVVCCGLLWVVVCWCVLKLCCCVLKLCCCVVALLRCCVVGLLRCWVVGLLGCWVVGLLGCWVVGLLGCWVVGLLGCWVVGLLGCWVVGLLGCWVVG